MNLNNLEDRAADMRVLGVSEKTIATMEELMKSGVDAFVLKEVLPATRGQVEVSIPFRQSQQSDHYYFSKFSAAHNKSKPLDSEHKYYVTLSDQPHKDGKTQFKSFESVSDALALFNKQQNVELSAGKKFDGSGRLALMESGKVNYVTKDFRSTLYAKPVEQTFYIDRGKGFTVEQAANLIQGRAVYKDDLVNGSTGEIYKAWVKLDIEAGKEKGNFFMNQWHDPQYGFDLGKLLDSYKIREAEDPDKREALESALKNGQRPLITSEQDGQKVNLYIETAVRYGKLNFYAIDGQMEKREQFQKAAAVETALLPENGKEKTEQQGLGV